MKLRQGWGTRRLYALTLASRAQATFEIIALDAVKRAPANAEFWGYDVSSMKTLLSLAAFLVCSFSAPLPGDTNPSPQRLLEAASQQANLFLDQDGPFQLDADFLAQMRIPLHGHVTLKWEAKDRWLSNIVMDSFEQTYIRSGDRLYISRSTSFTPVQVQDLISLLHLTGDFDARLVRKQEKRVENGLEMSCLQVAAADGKSEAHTVCVSGASHEIVSDEWREPPDGVRSERFTDYAEFGRHRYPRKLRMRLNGVTELIVDVTGLTPIAFDPNWLVAPDGAIERRQCAGMQRAVPIRTPQPEYPHSAIQSTMIGDTTVSLTVQTDGSVGDISLIGRASQKMDEATLNTLKGWRFTPARCGAESVVSDFVVVESFRLEPNYTSTLSQGISNTNAFVGSSHVIPLVTWHELRH
jgi:protein TonB